MSQIPLSCPTKRLAVAITASATTFQVNNIKGWDGNNLTSANFGTVAYVVFRNSTNTLMEIFEIDPTTIASSSITINKRGLDFNGGTSEVSANKLAWPANDTLVDFGSDTAQLFKNYMDKSLDENIAGIKTFSSSPIVPTPTTATQAANKSYVDGVAIAGAPDSSTSVKGIVKMSVAPVSATSPIAVGDNDSRVPTANQTAALAGNDTSIAVGSGNKVVTQTGLQNQAETYAASTGSANAYVLTLSPAPTAYASGQCFAFKANFANTGSATLNVNSLGAKTIKRLDGATSLVSGDIANGQVVLVEYDGTNFQMLTPSAIAPQAALTWKSVTASYTASSSSGTQNIAHGLGKTPSMVRITALYAPGASTTMSMSYGHYDGTNSKCVFINNNGAATPIQATSTNMVEIWKDTTSNKQVATITVDG